MQLPRLKSKRVEAPFWAAGGFGNKLRTWSTLEAFERDGCPCSVGLRYTSGRGGRGPHEFHIPPDMVAERVHAWIADGWDPSLITLCEMAPDHRLIINGELQEVAPNDWHFYYSMLKLPMREALSKGGEHMYGLRARLVLRDILTPASWDDLCALIELYPKHVIELSVYDHTLGDLPHRNMIPWEVRDY